MICFCFYLLFFFYARNGESVEGSTHKQVVDLIKSGGDSLTLTVISVPEQVAEKLEPSDESSGHSLIDYSEKRSLPISIPDYNYSESNGERYVAYNLYMAGRQLCSRRYKEFANLHNRLKREFPDFNFPKMPGKWPLKLSEQQLDARRRGLEQYVEKVTAVRVIGESDIMQEFLAPDSEQDGSTADEVELKVLLPDRKVLTVAIKRSSVTDEVYEAVVRKLGMTDETAKYFYLFEILDDTFDRKLLYSDFPHSLYIQNYSTAEATCIALKKWVFTLSRELSLSHDEMAVNFFFHQAHEEVSRGTIKSKDKLYELKALHQANKQQEYLKIVRHLDGYGEVVFPHCPCDAKKEGHVIVRFSLENLKLQACQEDGSPETQVIEFPWSCIKQHEFDEEGMTCNFYYEREGKKARWVRIQSPHAMYMYECFERIFTELEWNDTEKF
ncbi:sorting nexin-27 isoform X2 [Lingula anatina]|uniref:Sorting nexin-27 isoform X2 n=1 Tax=Lingula anatina TaxID=7574 RepID=A0A1S3I196_LINAN|nr:sorting nexin-27 isoform X2 [Lingula anatina]|eukprot:XP_013391119.1 sorting nexin-27 isoform X2 [Lingula anatina]